MRLRGKQVATSGLTTASDREQDLTPLQEVVGGRLVVGFTVGRRGSETEGGTHEMAEERRDHQLSITHDIRQQCAEQDDEAEAHQAEAGDLAGLLLGEAELGGPVIQDAAADAEADAGGQDGHESGP